MRKRWIVAAVIAAFAVTVTACGQKAEKPKTAEEPQTKNLSEEGETINGIYLIYGEEEEYYIFADENKSLFHAEIPEDHLFDEDGNKITKEELNQGDTLAIYGDGIMLESYPGRYPGVTKMERVKKGDAETAKEYEELIAQIYQAPDPSQIPYLDIENKQELAIVTTSIQSGGYTWSYTEENGEKQTVTTDAAHVLDWDYTETALKCDTKDKDLKLMFSKSPKSVKVTRWDDTATVEDASDGETVTVELDKKEAVLKNAVPGSVYEVQAEWEQGTVIYGFAVK